MFREIFNYLIMNNSEYKVGYTKADNQALEKRSKFFVAKEASLYYVGGELLTKMRIIHSL